MYYVPSYGPAIFMTQEARDWAERVGLELKKTEFADLERARAFADRIRSRVEDAKGQVLHDASGSSAA